MKLKKPLSLTMNSSERSLLHKKTRAEFLLYMFLKGEGAHFLISGCYFEIFRQYSSLVTGMIDTLSLFVSPLPPLSLISLPYQLCFLIRFFCLKML